MWELRSLYRRLAPTRLNWMTGGSSRAGRTRSGDARRVLSKHVPPTVMQTQTLSLAPDLSRQDIGELESLAQQIPSMGGSEIGQHLRKAARAAPSNSSIVEVGSWLGAGTAQLALGLRERQLDGPVSLHCFDRWEANEAEVAKAAMQNVTFRVCDDTLPWVMRSLQPFGVAITFEKGDFRNATWTGGPISIYVDDAAKTPSKFLHVLKTFGPYWIPGVAVVVFMDYHYWERTGSEKHKCQKRFIESHREHFIPIEGFRTRSSDAFVYRKQVDFGSLNYDTLCTDVPAK
ncbi:MAG: class I SAM-dependent methyltransferase [Xanthobacteraceae bacterium]